LADDPKMLPCALTESLCASIVRFDQLFAALSPKNARVDLGGAVR
jgi:hypothetical protein